MRNGRCAILIVDDEERVVESLQRTLRHENWELVPTTSPTRARQELEAGGIDVVVSDIDMPEMSGLEFVATTRVDFPEVLRVLLTGDASVQSALTAINEGAVHKYLTKPWRSQELRETLRALIAGIDALRQVSAADSQGEAQASRRKQLEARYPGITSVGRVDGAYLLNEARVVERLMQAGDLADTFAATRWLPTISDATLDMKAP
jgi:two-component system probable response regulator PhcQ